MSGPAPSTTASAPGKVILMGEHAAVYGRPALVAAADLRLRATVAPAARGVRLRVPGLGLDTHTTWSEILSVVRSAREAWERYATAPGGDAFRAVTAAAGGLSGRPLTGPASLLYLALGEAVDAAARPESTLPPIVLTVTSEIPVGSGFGSSAAAAVAVVLSFLAFRGAAPTPRQLHRISLEVERRQHGTPSGVDNATVIHGGVLEARRKDDGTMAIRSLSVRSERRRRFRIVDTGPPAEGTGAVVAAVRELRDRRRARTEELLQRLGRLTGALTDEICRPDDRPDAVVPLVREAEACLEELGVVPDPVRRFVRAVERAGGAAKISGAGSLAGPGAGNALLYHPDPAALAPLLSSPTAFGDRAPTPYDVELGAPGARLEPGARLGETVRMEGGAE